MMLKVIISLLLTLDICNIANAVVQVKTIQGFPTSVCQPNDTGTGCVIGGGSGSPAGNSGQVQYNNSGSFGGSNIYQLSGGNVGIGSVNPLATLHIFGNEYIQATPSNLIMQSANGSCYVLFVDNSGNLNVNSTSCPNVAPNNSIQFLGSNLLFLGSNLTY